MSNVTLAGWFWFPLSALRDDQLATFRSNLTYISPFTNEDGSVKRIELYTQTDTHIGLPSEWLKMHYPILYGMGINELVQTGELRYERLPDPYHKAVKNPLAQAKFMDDLEAACLVHNNVLAYAPTGSGKTVAALRVAAKLGQRTLVLVHTNQLKEQWISEIQDKLGVSREHIGVIQQDKCEIEGKYIVVGLLQTLARREFSDEIYNSFGTVIVDECHKLSTEFFASVVPAFNARYKIGLTATPRRSDGSDVVLYAHLGQIRVHAETEVMPVKVLVKNYYAKRKLWGNDSRQRLMALSRDPDRNDLIIAYLKAMYDGNRNILIVSHAVKHLEDLIVLAKRAGIPTEDIGQFTATRNVQSKTKEGKATRVKRTSTKAELDEAKTKKIIFATYNIIKEGIDIPRLDAGIDATPDWKATQLLGRIRRHVVGKYYPKWLTIRDMKCTYSQDMWNARVREYNESGAEIQPI